MCQRNLVSTQCLTLVFGRIVVTSSLASNRHPLCVEFFCLGDKVSLTWAITTSVNVSLTVFLDVVIDVLTCIGNRFVDTLCILRQFFGVSAIPRFLVVLSIIGSLYVSFKVCRRCCKQAQYSTFGKALWIIFGILKCRPDIITNSLWSPKLFFIFLKHHLYDASFSKIYKAKGQRKNLIITINCWGCQNTSTIFRFRKMYRHLIC